MTQHNGHISNSYFCPTLKWATLSALCFLKDKGQGKLANDASVRSMLFKPQLGMVLDNFSITYNLMASQGWKSWHDKVTKIIKKTHIAGCTVVTDFN